MTRARRSGEPVFVPRRFSPLRILWNSRMWVSVALLLLGYVLTVHTDTAPLYAKTIAFTGGAAIGLWRLRDTQSMRRAARAGEVRQAVVTHHESSRWTSDGLPLVRMVWSDVTGSKGHSRLGRPHDFPVPKTKIIVYADPRSGRTWWEDNL
jgi:hypothetical protein